MFISIFIIIKFNLCSKIYLSILVELKGILPEEGSNLQEQHGPNLEGQKAVFIKICIQGILMTIVNTVFKHF